MGGGEKQQGAMRESVLPGRGVTDEGVESSRHSPRRPQPTRTTAALWPALPGQEFVKNYLLENCVTTVFAFIIRAPFNPQKCPGLGIK